MKVQFFSIGAVLGLLGILIASSGFSKDKQVVQEVCPGKLTLQGKKKIKFSKLEIIFLCGDPETEAYAHIPPAQVKFHLSNFLQERGYFNEQWEEKGDGLVVTLGEETRVTGLEVNGAPPALHMERRREVMGRLLTPKFLNEIENWIRGQLKSEGYACPNVKSQGNIDDGVVTVQVVAGNEQNVLGIEEDEVPGTNSGVLRRFDAFRVGKPYNDDLLNLTANRTEKNGLLQNTYFTAECGADGTQLKQHAFAGKPRLFTLGLGFDTEQYAIVRTSWKHTRLGKNASLFDLSLTASYKTQEIKAASSLYFSPHSRWFLLPSASFIHDWQTEYHLISANAGVAAGNTWDNQGVGLRFSVGPNLNYVDTFRGAEPGITRFFSLRYDAELMSHYYEIFSTSPRTGFQVRLRGDFNNRYLLSDITAQRFALEAHYLHNWKSLDPPLVVFGVRGGFYGTIVDHNPATLAKLPPNYKFYLGGSQNLRGFALQELPNEFGALSAVFASFETRFAGFLPFKIQPFVFIDAGILGDAAFQFNLPVYFSPGAGIRYESPFGVFRTSFAGGLKTGNEDFNPDNTHFQFFISFGEEF